MAPQSAGLAACGRPAAADKLRRQQAKNNNLIDLCLSLASAKLQLPSQANTHCPPMDYYCPGLSSVKGRYVSSARLVQLPVVTPGVHLDDKQTAADGMLVRKSVCICWCGLHFVASHL